MRESSTVAVGRNDRDSPPANILQPLDLATSAEEDQDVGVSGVHLPQPSFLLGAKRGGG
jgi:hypothetical protein